MYGSPAFGTGAGRSSAVPHDAAPQGLQQRPQFAIGDGVVVDVQPRVGGEDRQAGVQQDVLGLDRGHLLRAENHSHSGESGSTDPHRHTAGSEPEHTGRRQNLPTAASETAWPGLGRNNEQVLDPPGPNGLTKCRESIAGYVLGSARPVREPADPGEYLDARGLLVDLLLPRLEQIEHRTCGRTPSPEGAPCHGEPGQARHPPPRSPQHGAPPE